MVAVISKSEFETRFGHYACSKILHVGVPRCEWAALQMVAGSVVGSAKFFGVIYAVQLIQKNRKINRKFIKKLLKEYLKSILYGVVFATGFSVSCCSLRHLLGRFYGWSVILIPASIAGCAIFLESQRMKNLDTIMFFNMLLQTAARLSVTGGLIRRTRLRDTFRFMCLNALLMHLLRHAKQAHRITNLWFFNPKSKHSATAEESNEIPIRAESWSRSINVYSKYFLVGYTIQIIRTALQRFGFYIKTPRRFLSFIFNSEAIKFGFFLASYATLYKVIFRYMRHLNDGKEKKWFAGISGFLAGATVCYKPDMYLMTLALTTILQIAWASMPEPVSARMPYATELLFAGCSGILMNTKVMRPDLCPPFVHYFVDACSNGIYVRYIDTFLKLYQVAKSI